MRIGKVHGRTETSFVDGTSQLQRKISVYSQTRMSVSEIAEPAAFSTMAIPEFALRDKKFLIGQWISTIDKIVTKPKSGLPSQTQFEQREAIGTACWNLLSEHGILHEEDSRYWQQRLHPYGLEFDPKTRWRGQWHDALTVHDVDCTATAKAIFDHLFVAERRRDGSRKYHPDSSEKKGLILNRAHSVERSVHKPSRIPSMETLWTPEDVRQYGEIEDPALKIRQMLEELSQVSPPQYRKKIGRLLSDHLFNLTGSRRCAYCETESGAPSPGLLALHDAVKKFYKALGDKKRNEARRKSSDRNFKWEDQVRDFPANWRDLEEKLSQQCFNRYTNHLVRFGRVFSYEGKVATEVKTSPYWTSEGQAQMKEAEAFVRVWRGSMTQATRAIKAWLDPEARVFQQGINGPDYDITAVGNINAILENEELKQQAIAKAAIYFGSENPIVGSEPESQRDFLKACLQFVASCRHTTFHYKTRAQLVGKLQAKLTDTSDPQQSNGPFSDKPPQGVFRLCHDDQAALKDRILADLKGAKLDAYGGEKFAALLVAVTESASSDETDIILPGFKKLMGRIGRVRNYIKGTKDLAEAIVAQLPPEPNLDDLKDAALNARYVGLFALYDGPFRRHLEDKSQAYFAEIIQDVNRTTRALAKHANQKAAYRDDMRARSEDLPPMEPNETLKDYFSRLVQVTAQEFEVQLGYNSNKAGARAQAAFIENFKRDVIGLAFEKYLRAHGFDWLLNIEQGQEPSGAPDKLPNIEFKPQPFEAWQAGLYLVLHFIPFDDVSRLLHQFKRWGALQGKLDLADVNTQAAEAEVNKFKATLNLYLRMHDGKVNGAGATIDLTQFRQFYKDDTTFKEVFPTETPNGDEEGDPDRLVHMRKGLRHILRYNHVPPLARVFGMDPVRADEVAKLRALEDKSNGPSQIEQAHKTRARLHKEAVEKKFIERDDATAYAAALQTIQDHKALVGRVYFGDQVRLHRLVMMVLARLIDYAGLWERDCKWKVGFIHQGIKYLNTRTEEDGTTPPREPLPPFQHPKGDVVQIRNDLDHFNVLNPGTTLNLTEQVNRVRDLMSYDRKLKNAVSKSIIELLEREGITLNWQMRGHQLTCAQICSPPILHFKDMRRINDKPTEARHTPSFLRMVAQVFDAELTEPEAMQSGTKGKGGKARKDNKGQAHRSQSGQPDRRQKGRQYGVVKWFNVQKSFGFIVPDGAGKDVFVHVSDVNASNLQTLTAGQRVSFELGASNSGQAKAVKIRLKNG